MEPHRETHEMTKTRKCFWRFVRVSGETSGSATDVLVIAPSAATHLTRRPRARNETARGSRLPRLMRLVFAARVGAGVAISGDWAAASAADLARAAAVRASSFSRQQCLYFRPEPQ